MKERGGQSGGERGERGGGWRRMDESGGGCRRGEGEGDLHDSVRN